MARPRLLTFKTSPNSGASTWESVVVTFSTSTNASCQGSGIGSSDHELTKTLDGRWKGGVIGYGLPIVLVFPSALLLDDPLIGVSDNAVLLVDWNDHVSTSKN